MTALAGAAAVAGAGVVSWQGTFPDAFGGRLANCQGVFQGAEKAFDDSFFEEDQPAPTGKSKVLGTFGPDFIADAAEAAIPALVNISAIQHGPWGR